MMIAQTLDDVYYPIQSGTGLAERNSYPALNVMGAAGGHDVSVLATNSVIRRLMKLRLLQDDWDTHGSRAPRALAVDRAMFEVRKFFSDSIVADSPWAEPLVGASEAGDVTFEWWSGPKKLTLYVTPEKTQFIKVWGTRIDRDMDDGVVGQVPFCVLWQWLNA